MVQASVIVGPSMLAGALAGAILWGGILGTLAKRTIIRKWSKR